MITVLLEAKDIIRNNIRRMKHWLWLIRWETIEKTVFYELWVEDEVIGDDKDFLRFDDQKAIK